MDLEKWLAKQRDIYGYALADIIAILNSEYIDDSEKVKRVKEKVEKAFVETDSVRGKSF